MSKAPPAIRCMSEAWTGPESLRINPTGGDGHACADTGEGRPSEQGGETPDARGDGGVSKVQRGAGQGGGGDRGRPALPELAGQAPAVRRQETHDHRRAVRGDQRARGRLLAVAGAVDGRGDGMAEARALRRRDLRDSPDLRDGGNVRESSR